MNKHVLYVPEKYVEDIIGAFVTLVGGATVSEKNRWYWRNANGTIVYDQVSLVTVFEPKRAALDYGVKLLLGWGEEAVVYEVNGVYNSATKGNL